jgi:uncharacterized protein
MHKKYEQAIAEKFDSSKKYTLLFSGGYDSSVILGTALAYDIDILPVWINNGLNRADEDEISEQAHNLGANHLKIIKFDPDKEVCSNPENRCYLCKAGFLDILKDPEVTLLDGTKALDKASYRPGLKALKEYDVQSFMADIEMAQKHIEEMAIHYGADPHLSQLESCLATRFNYGIDITPMRLEVIRDIEKFIIGQTRDYNVRCRIDDPDHMRIELSAPEAYAKLAEKKFRDQLITKGNNIAMFVTVDMQSSRPNEYDKRIGK